MDRVITFAEALREATDQEMGRDDRVFVLGQGVDDHKGIWGTTRGLAEKYGPKRCHDTTLSEDGITGIAIGAALAGLRPIHVHIRMDFMILAANQIVNMAAKMRSMFGGAVKVPLVIRSVIGRSWGQGAQHSQALHSWFMHTPGLRVVAPSVPYDAKGLLTTAIRDDNPVVFVEHRMVHTQKGHVPPESYTVPFGKARYLAHGNDVTIVGILHAAVESLRARDCLTEVGIAADVIDPVSLSPLDVETIAESVARTGRLLVADMGWAACGASAEIIVRVGERLQGEKAFMFHRITCPAVVCPTPKNLENLFYPNPATIAAAAYKLVHGPKATWTPDHVDAPEVLEFKGPF